jgi:hypothetical protein
MRTQAWRLGSLGLAVTLGVAVVAVSGCGEPRSAPGWADFARLGAECGDVRPVAASEIDVDDEAPECDEGYCLHAPDVARGASESSGMCSCRCDGEEGTGPFCTCSDGFVCREEVRALGLSRSGLTGSYCVPLP